jgi:polyisoprenoid-binding protein YceI
MQPAGAFLNLSCVSNFHLQEKEGRMRRRTILAAAVLCLIAPGLLHAAPWEFDPDHTGVHFKVRHLMVSSVRGEFEKVSGKIVYDEADVTKSTADITIDAASVNTRVTKRDADLRSPNFLDVAKYPGGKPPFHDAPPRGA